MIEKRRKKIRFQQEMMIGGVIDVTMVQYQVEIVISVIALGTFVIKIEAVLVEEMLHHPLALLT